TSCDSPYFLQTKDKTCVDACNSNQYIDTTDITIPKCSDCNILCLTCTDEMICKTCADGKFLNTNTLLCEACDTSCATCENGTDKTKCLSCSSPLYYQQLEKKCVTECYSNQYLNSSNICKACNSTCATCIDGISCSTCSSGSFINSESGLCELCDSNCKTCNVSKTACLSCNDPQYLQTNQTCQNSCLPKQYPDLTKKCQPCNISCLSCINGNSCSTCDDGMYIDSKSNY
ncbi:zinc finger lsd1 subclass family protein, putative, partial [Ichthyophthirius multifiliis]